MAQTIIGIDCGSYSVKISHLERSLRDFELVHFYEQVINQGTRLTAEEVSAQTLRAIFEKNEIPLENVAVSLPAHHLACRVLELPFTNVKKIEQTIEFELENYIPMPLEELLVDYHILSIEENRSTVLVAYMPRGRFVKYLELFKTAGVDPRYIGVDVIDLSHIAQISMVPQQGVYAIIDIGHEKTNICIMDGVKLQYVRSITVGGLHFTKAIQKAYNLNYEKAEGLKLDRGRVGIREDELDQVSLILKKVADELIVFTRQTYMGFKQIYADKQWSAIYLCGGGSKLAGLSDLISSTMRLNVNSLDYLDFINHRLENPDSVKEVMATSLAQTIKVIFSNKAVKINFRRGEFAYQRDIKALGSEMKQVGIWFSLVLFLGLFHFLFSSYTLQSRLKKFDQSVVKAAVKVLPEFKKQEKDSANKLLSVINGRIGEVQSQLSNLSPESKVSVLNLVLEISGKILPKNEVQIDLDDFSYTGDFVRLEGRTVSFEAVDKIKSALAGSPYFKNVTTQNVSKGVRDEIKFTLSMEVAGASKGGEKESG